MQHRNYINSFFGPVAVVSGWTLILGGIVISTFSLAGIFLIVAGLFVGFTHLATTVDAQRRRIKFAHYYFGILPHGKWVVVSGEMSFRIKKTHKVWKTYSRSNRKLETHSHDFRVVLVDASGHEILPVCRCKTVEEAGERMREIESLFSNSGTY
jgi:hypothetical protein